ncbi:MAG: zinc-binding dehydrogenase [Candidatus Wallbacteria bacterium]|nr:zinc-binding dehydrogenase [Candidatus Wallbacteria bacterium]
MKAVVIRQHGGPEELRFEERPVPEPGPGELLLRVKACSINHLDVWVRKGVPGHKFPLPIVPGCDASGVVEAAGAGVKSVAPGQRVLLAPGLSCGLCAQCHAGKDHLCRGYGIFGETRDGACAEFLVAPAVNAIPIPEELGFEAAAAIPLVFLTAWHMLVERAELRPGEDVLIQAAGSGVSSAAIQIAKLWGARVITTTSTPEKAARARELGADEVIDYRSQDFGEEVRRLTGKRGVDVVIEHVGGVTFETSVRCLARAGRLVTCGATTGAAARLDLRILFFKSISLLGSTMGSRAELFEILRHVASGKLRPVVDRVLPLDEVATAHRLLEERQVFGKVVVTP